MNAERRRSARYKVQENAVAFIGKSTCSILDISAIGISVRCSVVVQETTDPVHLDIFHADTHFYLPQLPVHPVNEVITSPHSVFSSYRIKRLGLQFGKLTAEQQSRLDEFIRYHMTLAH